jgi:hypothetical protein
MAKPDACHHNFVEPEDATNEGMSSHDACQECALQRPCHAPQEQGI